MVFTGFDVVVDDSGQNELFLKIIALNWMQILSLDKMGPCL